MSTARPRPLYSITDRQLDALDCLSRGFTVAKTARTLEISERQLRRDLGELMQALEADSHFELAVKAERNGLIDLRVL